MNQRTDKIQCPHCLKTFLKRNAKKKCSNCFTCQGCEIYQCPHCCHEVVIKQKEQKY